ncbi:MAG: S-layer homology domain-containing protein [Clostridia bacterium]|nr:S-layer homology domain-containing protein [Clostridia bacterium]
MTSSNSNKKTLAFNASSIGTIVLVKRTNDQINIELTGAGGTYLGPKTIPITRDVEELEIILLSGCKAVISKNGKTDYTLTESGIYELTGLNSAQADVNIKISFSKSGGSGGGGGGGGGAAAPVLPEIPEIKDMQARNPYIQGLADGTFKPEDNLNRASLATIINSLLSNGEQLDEKEIEELFEPYVDINPKS